MSRAGWFRLLLGACLGGLLSTLLAAVLTVDSGTSRWRDFWQTHDQQAQRLYDGGEFAGAAIRFTDPVRAGAAWYRAGEFDRATAAFAQLGTATGNFNRGNALLLTGDYEAALAAYDQALVQRPGWAMAEENRAIALARRARLEPPEDDAGGTGGMLGADAMVFDTSGRVREAGETQETADGSGYSDETLREMWLRRVETRPADFLQARFYSQLQQRQQVPE